MIETDAAMGIPAPVELPEDVEDAEALLFLLSVIRLVPAPVTEAVPVE